MHRLPPATMAGTETLSIESAILGDELQIDVSLPLGYESSGQSYPVVYLLDGYWYFPIVSHAVRPLEAAKRLPPLIIVGIGYKSKGLSRSMDEERAALLRFRDLTPTADASDWWRDRRNGKPLPPDVAPGHAETFLRFIDLELKPVIARRYRVNAQDATLAGFSLGGLCILFALFRHTAKFQRYVAASPSLWWDNRVIFDLEREYADRHRDLEKSLFLAAGEFERLSFQGAPHMVDNVKAMADVLIQRRYPSLRFESAILNGEDHCTGIAPAFVKGLLSVFRI